MTTPPDVLRRRRCAALRLAMVFGVLLPVFTRTWIALGVGLAGIAVAVFVYARSCRGSGTESAQPDTHEHA